VSLTRVTVGGGGGGSGALKITQVSGNVSAEYGQWFIVDPTAGNVTVTAPLAAGALNKKLRVSIVEGYEGLNTVTVLPQGSETLSGLSGVVLRQGGSGAEWQSDNANWIGGPL
jgi:hypothetical protein